MKSLFDHNERWTPEASRLENMILPSVRKAFDQFVEEGFNIREIEYVLKGCIMEESLFRILDKPPVKAPRGPNEEVRQGVPAAPDQPASSSDSCSSAGCT